MIIDFKRDVLRPFVAALKLYGAIWIAGAIGLTAFQTSYEASHRPLPLPPATPPTSDPALLHPTNDVMAKASFDGAPMQSRALPVFAQSTSINGCADEGYFTSLFGEPKVCNIYVSSDPPRPIGRNSYTNSKRWWAMDIR